MKYRSIVLTALLFCAPALNGVGFFSKIGQAWTKVFVRAQTDAAQFAHQWASHQQNKKQEKQSSWFSKWPSLAALWAPSKKFYPPHYTPRAAAHTAQPASLELPANTPSCDATDLQQDNQSSSSKEVWHIFFNLTDVTIKQNTILVGKVFPKSIWHFPACRSSMTEEEIENSVYQDLHALEEAPAGYANRTDVPLRNGKPAPYCTYEQLIGNRSPQQLLDQVIQLPKNNRSSSCTEATNIIHQVIFDPKKRVATHCLIEPTINLMKELKEAGHSLYIATNSDPEIINELYKDPRFAALHQLIPREHVVTSVSAKKVKQDSGFWRGERIRELGLDPRKNKLAMVEEQLNVLSVAEEFGVKTYPYDKSTPENHNNMKKFFQNLGILPK